MTSYLSPYTQASAYIDSKFTDNYILTIQYSLDGLSFIIFDDVERKFLCLKHYTINGKDVPFKDLLSELEEREGWKTGRFQQVKLLLDNNKSTLIPAEFYDSDISGKYLETLKIHSSTVGNDIIVGDETHNIYPVSDDIMVGVGEQSKEIDILHSSSVFINSLIKNFSGRPEETRAFVNVKSSYYELAILHNSEIVFHNYFNFNTKEDFLYFILFTFEQLRIDNETVPFYFAGLIDNNSTIVNLCSRYIRNIRFINRDNELKFSNELNSIPFYYYYTLYNSVTCE